MRFVSQIEANVGAKSVFPGGSYYVLQILAFWLSLLRYFYCEQRVLRLFYYESVDYQGIADTLGISINSVGAALSRARSKLAKALKDRGATKVVAYCTHAVLSGKALDNLRDSQLDELVVTDSIPLSDEARALSNIRQLTISDLLAESIRRVSNEESISALFDE